MDNIEESDNPYSSKDIYLKKDGDIIGLHATMFVDQQMEAWANHYTLVYKYIGSVFRIFQSIEQEAAEMKLDGWVEVPPPPAPPTPGPNLPEAA